MTINVLVVSACATSCGVNRGDEQRADVLARTCDYFLARRGLDVDPVDRQLFADAIAEALAGDRPFSSIRPLDATCDLIAGVHLPDVDVPGRAVPERTSTKSDD